MAKIRDKKKLLWCLRQFHEGKESQKWIATYLGVKPRRFRQLYSVYKQTLKAPDVGSKVGRPKKAVPDAMEADHRRPVEKTPFKRVDLGESNSIRNESENTT